MTYTIQTSYPWGNIPLDKINQIRKWLYCFVGEPYQHWQAVPSDTGLLIMEFIDDKDAVIFSLKYL